MRALSPAFGLLMLAAAAMGADGPIFALLPVAVAAVLVGVWWRGATTVAVGCAIALLVWTDPPAMVAALAGLAAAAYLVTRHAGERSISAPTLACALGFSAVAVLAAVIPAGLAWLPLAAPVAVVIVYGVIVRPFVPPG